MAKDLNKLKQELDTLSTTILGREAQLARLDDKDSAEAMKIRGMISICQEEYDSIKRQFEQAEAVEEKRQKKSNWKKEKPLVDAAIDKNYIGYIIPEDKFIYCRDHGVGQSNVQFKLFNATRIGRMMSKLAGTTLNTRDPQELIDYFEERGRTFLDVTSSFNKNKWNETEIYNKMSVIRDKWLQPDFDNAEQYDPSLDVLIECISGGKQENRDHLEQWVAFKYLNPERNANTPNLDLGGMPGGNGKGRFIELLKTIFTNACVIQAHKEELEKFNSNWEMAVILYYDEPEEKELAASKLKQATGSEDMRVEKKGIDATMADRNYNFVFMSNNPMGVVKLSGGSDGGEDRRYSVINTDLVLLDAAMNCGMSKEEALVWVNNLAQVVIKDTTQVSRWLAHIIKKHSVVDMNNLGALHGADYNSRFEDQKDGITKAFDAILPEFAKQGMIPLPILCDFVVAHTGWDKWTDRTIVPKWDQYLKRNKVNVDVHNKTRVKVMWRDDELKAYQCKVYNIQGGGGRSFDLSKITNHKPVLIGTAPLLSKASLLV